MSRNAVVLRGVVQMLRVWASDMDYTDRGREELEDERSFGGD